MDNCMVICKEILGMLEKHPNMLKAGDEIWASHYDLPLKQETFTWNFPGDERKKKVCQKCSPLKIMLLAFFDCQCMVYQTKLPVNQTIKSKYY